MKTFTRYLQSLVFVLLSILVLSISAKSQTGITGKRLTALVTIHGEKCCSTMVRAGMVIRAQNLMIPDTVYTVVTDMTGTAVISNMWGGQYKFTGYNFGCFPDSILATIQGDTTVNLILPDGVAYPPYGVFVDDRSLLCTWWPPRSSEILLNESWTSGNFTANGWTRSGGTNWSVNNAFGNPQPSVMFNYFPVVTNYDQYLTSRTFPATYAPTVTFYYEIYFNSFWTTTVNSMAVEIWDGTAWNVLKTYDNLGGSIPWTTEYIDLTAYSSQSFKIRFHAYGGNSYDINNWNIDNIRIFGISQLQCIAGYDVNIGTVLSGFTTDSSYQIPPSHVTYGHIYTVCITAIYTYVNQGYSFPDCYTFTSHFLYPPRNFTGDTIECNVLLSWNKPQYDTGGTPPGLIGYKIYRNGGFLHYCPSPDSLSYTDMNLDPGTWQYGCSAKYDLTSYGFPGQFGESIPPFDWEIVICGDNIPFFEGWDFGSFSYYDWTFEPSQGNWNITSGAGNPSPTAGFSWSKKKTMVINYDYSLVSPVMNGSQWICSHLWLGFDLKLIDHLSTSTEKMTVEIFYDNTWHAAGEYINNGSFGWTAESLNIDPARGKGFKIRFRAHGDNSTNILHWYVDNINIYGTCLPPDGLQWTAGSGQVNLSWSAPCPAISGYNIYRSDSTGNPPFIKINTAPVTETNFSDVPPGWSPDDMYRYFVTALQTNTITGSPLCESGASDTILVSFPTGIPGYGRDPVRIYPNPAGDWIIIRCDDFITRVQVTSNIGKVIYTGLFSNTEQVKLNTSGFSQGIYFVQISTGSGIFFRKFVICR